MPGLRRKVIPGDVARRQVTNLSELSAHIYRRCCRMQRLNHLIRVTVFSLCRPVMDPKLVYEFVSVLKRVNPKSPAISTSLLTPSIHTHCRVNQENQQGMGVLQSHVGRERCSKMYRSKLRHPEHAMNPRRRDCLPSQQRNAVDLEEVRRR